MENVGTFYGPYEYISGQIWNISAKSGIFYGHLVI
jgi:hypothetical protein